MIVVISLILYNMFLRKEHAITINVDEKLELTKIANNIKNSINSSDTTDLNASNGLILASNQINSIQYLFFIYQKNIGLIQINLSTGQIISSTHLKINKPDNINIMFKKNGDFIVLDKNGDKKVFSTDTIRGYNTLSLEVETQSGPYLRFSNDTTNDIRFINRMIQDLDMYLTVEIINNNLPPFIKSKTEKYLGEYINGSVTQQQAQQAQQAGLQQNNLYNINCNIDLNNKPPVIKSCSLIQYS